MRTLIALPLLLPALTLADAGTAGQQVKKETAEAVDATKRYANEKKEEFEARIDAKLKTLREDVTQIRAKAKTVARRDYEITVKELEARQVKADAKVSELKKAGAKAWSSLKGGVESAVDELEKGVKGAQ